EEQVHPKVRPVPFSSIWEPDAPQPPGSTLRDGGVILTVTGLVVFTSGLLGYTVASAYNWNGDADLRGPEYLMLGGGAATVVGVIMISHAPGPNAVRDQGTTPLYVGLTTRF